MSEAQTMSKDELLNKIKTGKAEFDLQMAGLSDAQMLVPGPHGDEWTVKDILAHLTACMLSMSSHLPGQQHIPFPVVAHEGESWPDQVQRLNDYYYAQFKDRSLAEVKADFEAAYQHTLAAVESLSEAQLSGADKSGLGEGDDNYDREARENIPSMVAGDTYEHFTKHLGYMAEWLKQHEQPHISLADMLARMASAHDELLAAISNLSDAQMTSPGPYPDSDWTVKDTLAHLAAWMRASAMLLRDGASKPYPFEEQPDESEDHFVERVNEYWYQRDKDKPLAEVRSEFEAAYQQQFAVMETLSDEQAVEPTHIKEHLGFISDWLKQQGQA